MMTPTVTARPNYRFLFLVAPALGVLLLAVGLFESSANITLDRFHSLAVHLTHGAAMEETPHFDSIRFLVEVKARYIWLTTVVVVFVVAVYALVLCGSLILHAHPRPRLFVMGAVGGLLVALGLWFLASLDATHVLYRAVYGFTYDNLQQAGPERIGPGLLRFAKQVVSVVNVQAVIVPVFVVLAACSTLAPPRDAAPPSPQYCALQLRRPKDVLMAGSAVLVAGILHMGAWLRWPSALVADKSAHEAVLGAALAITLYWGVTFTLLLVATYLPAATILARRAHALLLDNPSGFRIENPDQWLKEHGLFLTLQDHLPQFGLMLAPLLASSLSSLLLAPLNPTG